MDAKVQLDGEWSFQAQFRALGACHVEDDLAFKESSVKDISDRGRSEGVLRFQTALEEGLSRSSSQLKGKRKAPEAEEDDGGIAAASASDGKLIEAEVRRDVRALMVPLRELSQVSPTPSTNAAVLEIFRQLRRLQVSVDCLKATKVAAELNQPCWKGDQVSQEVREAAASLVRRWRSMYKSQASTSDEPKIDERKCRCMAVDLEACTHGQMPKTSMYCRSVEVLCEIIRRDADLCRRMVFGTESIQDLVGKNILKIKTAQVKRPKQ
eukprot:TRINITY_DN45342_c0_g1_i1.p1 TRINITY_DN45342_c0_g1~~TRINITY_DN45342_c0_g1_i1.p1  ORF type:complete len:286 (+),score=61.61 TRINITY_DN45342_c0_g1_i1:59-859(+)